MQKENDIAIDEELRKGINLLKDENYNESLKIFHSILKRQPKNCLANHNIGVALSKTGRFQEALSFFSFCQRDEPKNFEHLKEYIKTLICMGNISEARDNFNAFKKNYTQSEQLKNLEDKLNPNTKLDFFYKYLESIGVFECEEGEMVKINSKPLPFLTNSFLNWFETQLWSNSNLLELGSGSSTLYFSNYFNSVKSYENNSDWYNKMINEVAESVTLKFSESIASELVNEDFSKFDVVLIDAAESRSEISRILVKNKYKGIIFHDNAEWYRNSIEILTSAGYIEIPFFGLKPVYDFVASTSLLILKDDISKVFNSNWQKIPQFSSYRQRNQWDD